MFRFFVATTLLSTLVQSQPVLPPGNCNAVLVQTPNTTFVSRYAPGACSGSSGFYTKMICTSATTANYTYFTDSNCMTPDTFIPTQMYTDGMNGAAVRCNMSDCYSVIATYQLSCGNMTGGVSTTSEVTGVCFAQPGNFSVMYSCLTDNGTAQMDFSGPTCSGMPFSTIVTPAAPNCDQVSGMQQTQMCVGPQIPPPPTNPGGGPSGPPPPPPMLPTGNCNVVMVAQAGSGNTTSVTTYAPNACAGISGFYTQTICTSATTASLSYFSDANCMTPNGLPTQMFTDGMNGAAVRCNVSDCYTVITTYQGSCGNMTGPFSAAFLTDVCIPSGPTFSTKYSCLTDNGTARMDYSDPTCSGMPVSTTIAPAAPNCDQLIGLLQTQMCVGPQMPPPATNPGGGPSGPAPPPPTLPPGNCNAIGQAIVDSMTNTTSAIIFPANVCQIGGPMSSFSYTCSSATTAMLTSFGDTTCGTQTFSVPVMDGMGGYAVRCGGVDCSTRVASYQGSCGNMTGASLFFSLTDTCVPSPPSNSFKYVCLPTNETQQLVYGDLTCSGTPLVLTYPLTGSGCIQLPPVQPGDPFLSADMCVGSPMAGPAPGPAPSASPPMLPSNCNGIVYQSAAGWQMVPLRQNNNYCEDTTSVGGSAQSVRWTCTSANTATKEMFSGVNDCSNTAASTMTYTNGMNNATVVCGANDCAIKAAIYVGGCGSSAQLSLDLVVFGGVCDLIPIPIPGAAPIYVSGGCASPTVATLNVYGDANCSTASPGLSAIPAPASPMCTNYTLLPGISANVSTIFCDLTTMSPSPAPASNVTMSPTLPGSAPGRTSMGIVSAVVAVASVLSLCS